MKLAEKQLNHRDTENMEEKQAVMYLSALTLRVKVKNLANARFLRGSL